VRLVQIKSHQELLTTRPPPTDVLDFSSACTGRGGASAALPDVKSFFSALDPDLPSEPIVTLPRLKNTQRRRPAPDPDRPMGMADGGFMRQQIAHTRTAADMVGVSIEREGLRRIPRERVKMVIRPGFRERGQANLARAAELTRLEEEAWARMRLARADRMRNQMRKTCNAHRQQTLQLPVQQDAMRQSTEAKHAQATALAHEAARLGAELVAHEIPSFEGQHAAAGPPLTPGPPVTRPAAMRGAAASGGEPNVWQRDSEPDDGRQLKAGDGSSGVRQRVTWQRERGPSVHTADAGPDETTAAMRQPHRHARSSKRGNGNTRSLSAAAPPVRPDVS